MGIAGLEAMEASLTRSSWLAGDRLTIADVACYPYVKLAEEGEVSLVDYPAIQSWLSRVEALPGYVPMLGAEPEYMQSTAVGGV